MNPGVGYASALFTATLWSVCSAYFASAGRRVGSQAVGIVRLVFALIMLVAWCGISRGRPFPTDATERAWIYLSLSGFLGFFVGDAFLFRAHVTLGPRLSLLTMAIWPALAGALGWVFLDQTLGPAQIVGMTVTLGGILWVAAERRSGAVRELSRRDYIGGFAFAILGALGQASGLILSKYGMETVDAVSGEVVRYDAFSSTQIRTLPALLGYAVLVTVSRRWPRVRMALADRTVRRQLVIGSFTGPFLGVVLSLVAVAHINAGVAATLMATAPVQIIPISVLYLKERVSPRAVAGAVLAVVGVAVLLLVPA